MKKRMSDIRRYYLKNNVCVTFIGYVYKKFDTGFTFKPIKPKICDYPNKRHMSAYFKATEEYVKAKRKYYKKPIHVERKNKRIMLFLLLLLSILR